MKIAIEQIKTEKKGIEELIPKIKGMPGMNLEEPLFNTTETMD